jgi:hypothetical protein
MPWQNPTASAIVLQTLSTSRNPTDRRPFIPEFHRFAVLLFSVFDHEIQSRIIRINRESPSRIPIASEKIEPPLSLGFHPEYFIAQVNNVVFVPHRYTWPTSASAAAAFAAPGGPARRVLRRRRDGSGRQLNAELGDP